MVFASTAVNHHALGLLVLRSISDNIFPLVSVSLLYFCFRAQSTRKSRQIQQHPPFAPKGAKSPVLMASLILCPRNQALLTVIPSIL